MVRERERGRSGNIDVVARGVAKILSADISYSMRVYNTKMDVATRVIMAIMPSHFIPNMHGKNKGTTLIYTLKFIHIPKWRINLLYFGLFASTIF